MKNLKIKLLKVFIDSVLIIGLAFIVLIVMYIAGLIQNIS